MRGRTFSFCFICSASAAAVSFLDASSLTITTTTTTTFMPIATGAFYFSRRSFYGGLDESRVHRLRRSGITFNKPRGRDILSLAFESRVRVLPYLSPADLYGTVDPSLLVHHRCHRSSLSSHIASGRSDGSTNTEDISGSYQSCRDDFPFRSDPTSSTGNALEQQKAFAGDTRMQSVLKQKQQQEAVAEGKNSWNVLVVDPVALGDVEKAVAFPGAHPLFYQHRDAFRLKGREDADVARFAVFEHLPPLSVTQGNSQLKLGGAPSCFSSADPNYCDTDTAFDAWYLSRNNRRQLRQNGDTTLLPGYTTSHVTLPVTQPAHYSSRSSPPLTRTLTQVFRVCVCVDPNIDVDRYHREEAQVEMISAYRNIFYEAAEMFRQPGRHAKSASGDMTTQPHAGGSNEADVVRVPALCCYSHGHRFAHEIGKLNQQSIIKAFHRLSNEAKELLIINKAFTVELYVPPLLLPQFETAFLEEAWETPQSTLNPGRIALYPGLAPPRTLLQYDGWVGKRPELMEAVETQGKSLLKGPKYNLDGTEIHEMDVFSHIRLFGAHEAQQKRLAGERATAAAAAQLATEEEAADGREGMTEARASLEPTYASLRPGLQHNTSN